MFCNLGSTVSTEGNICPHYEAVMKHIHDSVYRYHGSNSGPWATHISSPPLSHSTNPSFNFNGTFCLMQNALKSLRNGLAKFFPQKFQIDSAILWEQHWPLNYVIWVQTGWMTGITRGAFSIHFLICFKDRTTHLDIKKWQHQETLGTQRHEHSCRNTSASLGCSIPLYRWEGNSNISPHRGYKVMLRAFRLFVLFECPPKRLLNASSQHNNVSE